MADPTSPSEWAPSGSTDSTSLKSQGRRQDSSGESTATNVDTTDAFRQGFPTPLRPLPQANFIVEPEDAEKMQWWEPTRQTIVKYLLARDITWESVGLINRRNPRDEGSEHDLTILITAPRDTSSDSWYLMLQGLHTYLQENGLSYVRVEMIDQRYARPPSHFIVEPSHPLVFAWPNLRHRIIEALCSRPWLTLTAVRRGIYKSPEENPITIVITTLDPPCLRSMLEPIMSICADAGFPLQAEVMEGRYVFGMNNLDETRIDASDFRDLIPMGSSISASSVQDRSGTMGGAIILKNNLRIRVGETNLHVLWAQDTPKIPEFVDDGLRPQESSNLNIQVVIPSNRDTQLNLASLKEQLENGVDQPIAMAKRWERFNDERDARNIQRLKEIEQVYHQDMNMIQIFNPEAGNLWAGSGFRIHPQTNFGLDWALIQLPDHRLTPNLLPTLKETIPLHPDTAYVPPASLKLEEWSTEGVRGGENAYKRGRTTGLTRGKYNSINPAVRLGGKVCSAWQIVGRVGKEFCQPGDSGSFVIDSRGRWCALLFASPYYTNTGDAFVLPVDELIADIEYLTGGTVSLS